MAIVAELGGMTADEFAARATLDELHEWKEFFKIRAEEQKKQLESQKPKGGRKRRA